MVHSWKGKRFCQLIKRSEESAQLTQNYLKDSLNWTEQLADQEDCAKKYQEIKELTKICSTEAEGARQLRNDELSTQEEER